MFAKGSYNLNEWIMVMFFLRDKDACERISYNLNEWIIGYVFQVRIGKISS